MGRLEEIQKIKAHLTTLKSGIKANEILLSKLEKAKQLNPSELMKVYLNNECGTVKPRDIIEGIEFPESYCAEAEAIGIFARTISILNRQEIVPTIYIINV